MLGFYKHFFHLFVFPINWSSELVFCLCTNKCVCIALSCEAGLRDPALNDLLQLVVWPLEEQH